MDKINWDYSEYSDILNIHRRDELTKGSVEMGDFTLDFGKDDSIVGIEIEHASEFFGNLDINKRSLNEIKGAEMIIDNRNPSYQLIYLKLKLAETVKKVAIPMPVVS